jgi:hypothetical protein
MNRHERRKAKATDKAMNAKFRLWLQRAALNKQNHLNKIDEAWCKGCGAGPFAGASTVDEALEFLCEKCRD